MSCGSKSAGSNPARITAKTRLKKAAVAKVHHDEDNEGSGGQALAEVVTKGTRVQWDDKRTERLVEWLENNPVDRQKLFSDSAQDAKEENHRHHVAKGSKLAFHMKMATYIFSADKDPQVRQDVQVDLKKYSKAVENRITHLKRKYREINAELGQTGAGLTAEEIQANPNLKSILDTLLPKFPIWERLHGLWHTLPNFNPYTVSSEPGQDLEQEALAILFPSVPSQNDRITGTGENHDIATVGWQWDEENLEEADAEGIDDSIRGSGQDEVDDSGNEDILHMPPPSQPSGCSSLAKSNGILPANPSHDKTVASAPSYSSSASYYHNSNTKGSSHKSSQSNKRSRVASSFENAVDKQQKNLAKFAEDSFGLRHAQLDVKRQKMELKLEQEREFQCLKARKEELVIQERMRDKEYQHKQRMIQFEIELARLRGTVTTTSAVPSTTATTTPSHSATLAHSLELQPANSATHFYNEPLSAIDNYYLTGPSGVLHNSEHNSWGSTGPSRLT